MRITRNPGRDDGSSSAQQVALITQTSPLSLSFFRPPVITEKRYRWSSRHTFFRACGRRDAGRHTRGLSLLLVTRVRDTRLTRRGTNDDNTPSSWTVSREREKRRGRARKKHADVNNTQRRVTLTARARTRNARDGEQIWTEARVSQWVSGAAAGLPPGPLSLSLYLPPAPAALARSFRSRCQVADPLSLAVSRVLAYVTRNLSLEWPALWYRIPISIGSL